MDWFEISMGLLGGMALFLFGLDQLAKGLQAAAGESMKVFLAKLTENRVLGAITGAVVTAVLNSSSVTTVLVVGFISAGLMTLSQSISVIMGANIGSTATAQIVAFNVTRYALAMIGIGFVMLFAGKRDKVREWGSMIMGLGLVFYGMGVMGDSMAPLRSYGPFMEVMVQMEKPVLGIVAGALFTGLVQSSAATMGIAIVLASGGLVTLPAGIALALGANIGTCVTAVLAAIGRPRDGQRAAAAHVLFNLLGVLLWVGFIDQLAGLAIRFSPVRAELTGAARMAAEVPRQIANANTIFNVINTMLFLPFTGLFAKAVTKLLPDRPVDERVIIQPRYLDAELLETPSLALDRVRMEIGHMGEVLEAMWSRLSEAFESRDRDRFDEVARMDDQIDILQAAIVGYLGEIRQRAMSDTESRDFLGLMSASSYLESIGDVLETAMVELGHLMLDKDLHASETMRLALTGLGETVGQAVDAAIRSVAESSETAAQEVLSLRNEVDRQIQEVMQHQATKLGPDDPQRLDLFRLETGVVDALKRTYTLAKRIARIEIPKVLLEDQAA
jgi:phosphate:Na+ symporter